MSAYTRDRRLHHHLRGLLAIALGQNDDAVEEFRQAMHSPSAGFTRANLELGRLLTRLERPREAIPVLQAALRGPLETNGFYATHTELHRALAAAFTTAGLADSAAVHQQWVDRATRS